MGVFKNGTDRGKQQTCRQRLNEITSQQTNRIADFLLQQCAAGDGQQSDEGDGNTASRQYTANGWHQHNAHPAKADRDTGPLYPAHGLPKQENGKESGKKRLHGYDQCGHTRGQPE